MYMIKTYYNFRFNGLDGLFEKLEDAKSAIESNKFDLSENGTNNVVIIQEIQFGVYPEGHIICQYIWNRDKECYEGPYPID